MYNHVKFANFVCTFVLRDIKVYKIRKLYMTVFSTFYDILQPNNFTKFRMLFPAVLMISNSFS